MSHKLSTKIPINYEKFITWEAKFSNKKSQLNLIYNSFNIKFKINYLLSLIELKCHFWGVGDWQWRSAQSKPLAIKLHFFEAREDHPVHPTKGGLVLDPRHVFFGPLPWPPRLCLSQKHRAPAFASPMLVGIVLVLAVPYSMARL